MSEKNAPAKRGYGVFVLPAIYLALCVISGLGASEGSWGWFIPFLAALPISIVLLPLTRVLPPSLVFGVLGTLWWFAVSYFINATVRRVIRKARPSRERPQRDPA